MSSYSWNPLQSAVTGVTTLDGLSGALTLVAGTGISIVDGVSTITIASTSAGDVTLTAFGSTPNANGASLSGQALTLQPADSTRPGGVSTTTQTFGGAKTFASTISASNLSGTNTGDVTIGTANGLSLAGQVLSLQAADATHTGALTSTDWSTFNNKQSTISFAAVGSSPNANGAVISGGVITLEPASVSFPGVVNNTSQTFSGSKTFPQILNADGGIDVSGPGTLTIGATNSTTINIGNSGATVNIQGTTIYENTPLLQVTDPLITVNHGGGAGSGQNAGIEVEENAIITGYAETSADRNSWIFKAPNTAGIATLTPGAGGITIDQSSHNPVTIGTANGLSISTQVLSLQLSTTSLTGALSSTDWNTFNNKQAAGNYITALTGDATASGPGSAALTLATVNSNVGSFGSSTSIPSFTVNAKGLITAASGNVVIASAGTLSGTTLNATVASSSLTSVGTITTGVWNGTTIAIANGGTGQTTKAAAFDALSPMTTGGDLIYGGASGTGLRLANGTAGQILQSNGTTTAPSWVTNTSSSNYTAQTTTYTAVISDYVNCTSGTFTVTLPTAVSQAGKSITVKNSGTGVITINTTSSQTIDALASGAIKMGTRYDSITVTSDGANWTVAQWGIEVIFNATASGQTPQSLNGTTAWTLTSVDDPQSAFNGTTTYTVPYSGYYYISFMADMGVVSTGSVNNLVQAYIMKSATAIITGATRSQVNSSLNDLQIVAQGAYKFVVGDTVTFNLNTNFTTPGTTGSAVIAIYRVGS